jgi:prepilin-type N-terminal cleavage/methylation domain-containing protein
MNTLRGANSLRSGKNSRRCESSLRSGFTLIEVMIAITILGLVIGNVYMVLGDSSKAFGSQTTVFEAETQARRTLDRIALAVVGASRATLFQTPAAPASTPELNFTTSQGLQDGAILEGNPQRISLANTGGFHQVTWAENPGTESERKSVWTKFAAEFLEGEELNGEDDNGNGLIDEKGLNFVLEGNSVLVQLTIARKTSDGTWITRTLEARVTCRN